MTLFGDLIILKSLIWYIYLLVAACPSVLKFLLQLGIFLDTMSHLESMLVFDCIYISLGIKYFGHIGGLLIIFGEFPCLFSSFMLMIPISLALVARVSFS